MPSCPQSQFVSHETSPKERCGYTGPTGDRWRRLFFGSLRVTIYALDKRLRRILGIFEFCSREDCLLRIEKRLSPVQVSLPDRTEVKPGDEIIELHFWNENLSLPEFGGSFFGWCVRFHQRMRVSFALLAAYAETDPEIRNAKAFHARLALPVSKRFQKRAALAGKYGFTIVRPPSSLALRAHDLFENILIYSLRWAFQPFESGSRLSRLERMHWWISREELLRRYRVDDPTGVNRGARSILWV
jgi:hypothetical protein